MELEWSAFLEYHSKVFFAKKGVRFRGWSKWTVSTVRFLGEPGNALGEHDVREPMNN